MNNAKKNIALQLIYQLFATLTPLITSPYLSRVLGAEQLGIFSSTFSYVCYFTLICKLGVDTYGCREIAKVSGDRKLVARKFYEIYSIQIAASLLAVLAYAAVLTAGQVANRNIMLLQGLWILSSLTDINWLLFGLEEFAVTTVRSIAIKIVLIVLIFLVVKTPADLDKYILIMAGGQVVSMAVVWPYAIRRIGKSKIDLRQCVRHLKPLLYFFIPVMAMSVFHIMDKTMLGLMSTAVESGYYYNVDRLGNMAIGVSLGINTVMLPRITNSLSAERSAQTVSTTLEKSYELVVSSTIAICMGLAAIGPLFVPVFFGREFMPCTELIDIFAVALVCKSISSCICNQCLIPMDEEKYYIRAVVIGALVNLVSNWFLIRQYAAKGATIGTVIAEAVVMVIVLYRARGRSNLKKMGIDFVRYLLIGIAMFVAVRAVIPHMQEDWTNLILVIIMGGMIFAAGTFICSRLDRGSVFAELFRRKGR